MCEKEIGERSTMVADILWLLGEVDKLEDARNDCVHSRLLAPSALALVLAELAKVEMPPVMPDLLRENKRALKLRNKDLLTEFRWCRDQAVTLANYARLIGMVLLGDKGSWPRKPKLPNRGLKKPRRSARRQSPAK